MRVFKKRVLLSNHRPWINKRRREIPSRHDISPPKHIPVDLTFEILSRLPAKSILRFRCVSKLWSSLTRLPSFNNSFMSSRKPRVLVTFSSGVKQYYGISFPQHQNPGGSYPPFTSFQIKKPYFWPNYAISKSVHGLVLLSKFNIWNPTLGRFSALPQHPSEHIVEGKSCISYLGYDPLEGKHKVLCIVYKEYSKELWVLTLGAKESWRILTKGIPMHRPIRFGNCFNGVLYYKARLVDDDQYIIMSFDVKSESFSSIKVPEARPYLPFHMIHYEGRLALVTCKYYSLSEVDLYIMKDADGHEWTHQSFINIPCKRELRYRINYWGCTDDGELVFAPFRLSESYYILYFDPRRNSTREVLFEGVLDEIRCRYGFDTNSLFNMEYFPNHIESLLCL